MATRSPSPSRSSPSSTVMAEDRKGGRVIHYWMDGKIPPVQVPEEDVEIAKLYVQEGKPRMEIIKMFMTAYKAEDPDHRKWGLSQKTERAVCVAHIAEQQLGVIR